MLDVLNGISNSDLLSAIKGLKNNENKTIAAIVLYLFEIDCRGLYRDAGYSSLFSYCTEALGYSEGAAFRRITAARALKDNPEIYELLIAGKLSLCAVAEIAKVIKPENKLELLETSIGKPKAEVQRITAKYQVAKIPLKRERVSVKKVTLEPQSSLSLFSVHTETKEETRFTFTVEVDEQFMELLNEAKKIVGPIPMAEIFRRTLKEFVQRRNKEPGEVLKASTAPKEAESKENPNTTSVVKPTTRYIPKSTQFQIKARDQHQCTFISPDGHRCTETRTLQVDHIVPFARGGANEASNLRLLCPAHNRLCAERVFGKHKIESYFHRGGDSHSTK